MYVDRKVGRDIWMDGLRDGRLDRWRERERGGGREREIGGKVHKLFLMVHFVNTA
jgi:hypothetical protein